MIEPGRGLGYLVLFSEIGVSLLVTTLIGVLVGLIFAQLIALRLRGVKSNRDAIGARVEVNGRVQCLSAGGGYLAQHSKQMHFEGTLDDCSRNAGRGEKEGIGGQLSWKVSRPPLLG